VANLTVVLKDDLSGRGISAESLFAGNNDEY
jgi:hypothetical protein